MEDNNKSCIYGIKTGDVFHYIGKTDKKDNFNKSDMKCQYHNKDIRNVFINNSNVEIVDLSPTSDDAWYDDKLKEVIIKNDQPLLNAQWMLEGKHGYWSGKIKDKHTINRLSESKYKKLCQYDSNGILIKIYNSYKEAATTVFNDYKIINGGANSELYRIIKNKYIKKRFSRDSYWLKEEELITNFGTIPIKLNIDKIIAKQKEAKRINKKAIITTEHRKYTVIHFNNDGSIKRIYHNTDEAAYVLKTTVHNIQKLCSGRLKNNNYLLKYGEKLTQPVNTKYEDYKILPLVKEIKKVKSIFN